MNRSTRTGGGSQPPAVRARRRPARKLKPGPGLTPEAVFADQRRRICAAMTQLVADGGYESVTVRALTKQAGVSTRTFYRHFDNATDCLGFTCESTLLCALRRMEEAGSEAQRWDDRLRASVASLMRDAASQPAAARVALVEAFAAGPLALERLEVVTETFEERLAELLSAAPRRAAIPRQLVGGMVAGVMRVARTTTLSGRTDELPGMAPGLSEWVLSIARGAAARRSDLTRAGARSRREDDPFPDGRPMGEVASVGDDRDRIRRATLKLAARGGYSALTIPRIRVAAGVSRRSFDSCFPSVSECFLDSVEWLVRSAVAGARSWAGSDPDRDRRMQRLILALSAQAARNGPMASLVFVAVLAPGRDGLLRRERWVAFAVAAIRADLPTAAAVGDLSLEASAAAAWQIAYAEVAAGRAERLPGLSPLLADAILAPLRHLESRRGGLGVGDRQH